MHSIIYNISYAAFPFLIGLIFFTYKNRKGLHKKKSKIIALIIFYTLSISFIYARFIERNIVIIQTTEIETGFSAKIVVISDTHLGVYKNQDFLKKVVEKINKIKDADAVLIPGDFTYYPTKTQNLTELFEPLKNIKVPVYGILGNHDSEKPGPPLQKELQEALETNNIIFLHNTSTTIKNTNIKLLGLGDEWAKQSDIAKIENFTKEENLIVMTHNPDTTSRYTNAIPDITITGHTHGGQIRLPFVYKSAIPCKGDFDQGLYEEKHGKVFVTSGVGETGLPMRLGIPPVIDILEFK